jgi:hypothetical protein
VLDYKDVTFSFQDRRKRQRRRRLALLLLALLAGAVFLGLQRLKAGSAVAAAEELLLAGRLEEAGRRLRSFPSPLFQRADFRELQALHDLCSGRLQEAAGRFQRLRADGAATTLRAGRFLARFLDRGEYSRLEAYSGYLLPRGGDEARWYHALALSARLDADGADRDLDGLSAAYRQANAKAVGLIAGFNRSLRSGRVDFVFDRGDEPIAFYDVRRGASRPLLPGMDFAPFAAQFRAGTRRFRLTLDAGLQRRVDRLFQGRSGSLVVLELPESAVLVAYSRPRSGRGGAAAFHEAFNPGSVVKIVSLLAYLRSGADVFPLECRGNIAAGGRIVYDLEKHGLVRDPAQALARSCNVAFTRMARAAGAAALSEMLRLFFFNGPGWNDRFLRFAAGRFDAAGDDLQLARLASGLEGITMTTVQAAALAAVFAQGGEHFSPYLIDDAKNVLGIGYYRHEPRMQRLLADDLNFLKVRQAMAAVVEDGEGTLRRLRGIQPRLAAKTGTVAGAAGLDAVIAGFLPYERPRYAFALRLEGAGRADLAGADLLRELLPLLSAGQP